MTPVEPYSGLGGVYLVVFSTARLSPGHAMAFVPTRETPRGARPVNCKVREN